MQRRTQSKYQLLWQVRVRNRGVDLSFYKKVEGTVTVKLLLTSWSKTNKTESSVRLRFLSPVAPRQGCTRIQSTSGEPTSKTGLVTPVHPLTIGLKSDTPSFSFSLKGGSNRSIIVPTRIRLDHPTVWPDDLLITRHVGDTKQKILL